MSSIIEAPNSRQAEKAPAGVFHVPVMKAGQGKEACPGKAWGRGQARPPGGSSTSQRSEAKGAGWVQGPSCELGGGGAGNSHLSS